MMAAAVDPFSIATAELSDDYVNTFPDPDVVWKYLEELSDRTGVVVFVGDNSVSVKGSWGSLNSVRSILSEFLISHQTTQCEDDKKDIDLFESESPPFSDDHEVESNNEEDDKKTDSVARFRDTSGDPSNWIKWTAEVLPQIQPVRSKRTCEYSQPKQETNTIPEPLVLYAEYQPTPDPAAKVPPTIDAIEKVLKTVYDTNKQKASPFSIYTPTLVTPGCTTAGEGNKQRFPCNSEQYDHSTASVTNQNQDISHSVSGQNNENKPDQSNSGPHSVIHGRQRTLPTVSEAANATSVRDEVKGTVLSLQELSQQDLSSSTPSQTCSAQEWEQNEEVPRRQSRRKRKERRNSAVILGNTGMQSDTKLKKEDDLEEQVTLPATDRLYGSTIHSDLKVRGTRRKGKPRKNKKFQSETPESQGQDDQVNAKSGTPRAAKRKSLTPMKAELSESSSQLCVSKQKTTRPRQISKQEVIIKELVKEGKIYICELCPYVAKKLNHLREHKRRVHIMKGKEFKCEECGKIFGFGKDLRRHYLTHQKAENCCDICGKMYKGIRNLAEHKKTHESNYIKPEFPCEFCQKTFSTKYVLAYHVKSEHLGVKKTYLCPTCGKSFSQKSSYLQHANVHMGIKAYQCDICGKSFSYDKSLKEHKYMHQDDKQFECHVCHKKFRQSSGVAIHMKIHKEHKDYVCSACGKGFSQKQAMIRHERIHMGVKPFSCSLCKRSFTDSSILRRHMILIHKKDKDKWREDTESNVQRSTDFFISVVAKDGALEEGQASHQGAGNGVVTNSKRHAVQVLPDNPVAEPASQGGGNESCQTSTADADFSFIPVGIGTVTSSSSESIMAAISSMSLPHILQYNKALQKASDSGTFSTDSIHDCVSHVSTVQTSGDKLEPETVFGMPLGSAHMNPTSSQTVHRSSQNETQLSLQGQVSSVLNSYTFSEASDLSSSAVGCGEAHQSSTNAADIVHYPSMVEQASVGYHPNMVTMSDALAALEFHSGAMNATSSSQEHPADCERLVSGSSILQAQQYSDTQHH